MRVFVRWCGFVGFVTATITAQGCVDLRKYDGSWEGTITAEPALRKGFADDVQITKLLLSDVQLDDINAEITTSDAQFESSDLQPITRVSADALSNLTFTGNPLRSYMLYSHLSSQPEGDPAWFVLTLFADDRIELRIIRQNNLFGVFQLSRIEDPS